MHTFLRTHTLRKRRDLEPRRDGVLGKRAGGVAQNDLAHFERRKRCRGDAGRGQLSNLADQTSTKNEGQGTGIQAGPDICLVSFYKSGSSRENAQVSIKLVPLTVSSSRIVLSENTHVHCTLISTSSSLGVGTGTSSWTITSRPPVLWICLCQLHPSAPSIAYTSLCDSQASLQS